MAPLPSAPSHLCHASGLRASAAQLSASIGSHRQLCGVATLITPLGLHYWPEIVASIERSRANAITEWRPPDWPPGHLAFWAAAVASRRSDYPVEPAEIPGAVGPADDRVC